MKNWYHDQIIALANKTGYSEEFLLDMWDESDGDWEYFVGVTLERDW